MIKINQIKLPVTHSDEALKKKIINLKSIIFLLIYIIVRTIRYAK